MKIYIYSFIIFVLVLFFHILGNDNGLYIKFWYYDIFMHIAGGIGMALLATAFLQNHFLNLKNRRTVIILFVFLVGLIWELFEAYNNIAGYPVGTKLYYLDTIKDLFDDVLGGVVVVWLSRIKI